jgi:hypothetical protein
MFAVKTTRAKFWFACVLSLFTLYVIWDYGQYWPAGLGLLVGGLRVWLFWKSTEGVPFVAEGIQLPAKQRLPEKQLKLERVMETYEVQSQKQNFFKDKKRILLLLLIAVLVVFLDKRMIFYCFFMAMMDVWFWHQWFLAYRVGRKAPSNKQQAPKGK